MRLSRHFTLSEFTRSQTADRLKIDNTPSMAVVESLKKLCVNVLEHVRQETGRPVIITSGYRSTALNLRIGGSPRSQHCLGEAADLVVLGKTNYDVAALIVGLGETGGEPLFDQLILEYWRANDPLAGWVHVSWTDRYERRGQVLNVDARFPGRYASGLPALDAS